MNNRRRTGIPVVGIASLLVIFAVLSITMFSIISLSSALASERINEASLNAVYNFYRADTEAEEIFMQIRNGHIPEGVIIENDVFSFSCYISPVQTLEVEIKKEDGKWEILRWQTEAKREEVENTEKLWDGKTNIGG